MARHSRCHAEGRGEARGPGAAGGAEGLCPGREGPPRENDGFFNVWDCISAPMGDGARGETGGSAVLSPSIAVDLAGWRVGAGPRGDLYQHRPGFPVICHVNCCRPALSLFSGPQSTFSCILFLSSYLFTHRPDQDLPGAHVLHQIQRAPLSGGRSMAKL